MASDVRIYAVSNGDTGETHFVKAANQPQAMRHIARSNPVAQHHGRIVTLDRSAA